MDTQREFEILLADQSKKITDDIRWLPDQFNAPAQRFRVDVLSEPGWPLKVQGWWNPDSAKLSYTLIHTEAKRIIGLDLGDVEHHNPDCERKQGRGKQCSCPVGTHKHRWTVEFKARFAYVPADITATWDKPLDVWRQFCEETSITHRGTLREPEWQGEMSL